MKLIVCRPCRDIVALSSFYRRCKCGESKARYMDKDKVRVHGPCFVIGIENGLRYGEVDRCEAFVIPDSDVHVERVG